MPPKKLNRSDRQAENIVGNNINVNTKNRIHKYAVETVKKCINGEIYENFINYFEVNHYNKDKAKPEISVPEVPKVRLRGLNCIIPCKRRSGCFKLMKIF